MEPRSKSAAGTNVTSPIEKKWQAASVTVGAKSVKTAAGIMKMPAWSQPDLGDALISVVVRKGYLEVIVLVLMTVCRIKTAV